MFTFLQWVIVRLVWSTAVPEIVEFPEDTDVMEGERVVFGVRVTGAPDPKFVWYHDGEEVVGELSEDGSLTMPSAETKHSGVYQLVAHNPAGRVERQLILRVKKKEQEDSQSASQGSPELTPGASLPVALFGNFVEKFHSNQNKQFKDQYQVHSFSSVVWLEIV